MDARSATQDATLYLLHAAFVLAVGNDATRGHRDQSASSSSQPLPLLGATQARKFLQAVLDQTTTSEIAEGATGKRRRLAGGGGCGARSLWLEGDGRKSDSTVAATASICSALDHLPAHWRLHNVLCQGCGSIALPGITTASTRGKRRRDFVCLVCCKGHGGQGKKRNGGFAAVGLHNEDHKVMKSSKAAFASARKRRTDAKSHGAQPPMATKMELKPPRGASRSASMTFASASAKGKEARRELATASPSPPAPSTSDRASSSRSEYVAKPASLFSTAKQTNKDVQPVRQAEQLSAPTSPSKPLLRGATAGSAPGTDRHEKRQDHKAALRAMLSKDKGTGTARDKKRGQPKADGSRQGGATGGGGGGLADFLAGLS